MAELKTPDTVRTAKIYDASENFNYFAPLAEGYSDGLYAAHLALCLYFPQHTAPHRSPTKRDRWGEEGQRSV